MEPVESLEGNIDKNIDVPSNNENGECRQKREEEEKVNKSHISKAELDVEVAQDYSSSANPLVITEEYETSSLKEENNTDIGSRNDTDEESVDSSSESEEVPIKREEGDGQESENKEKKLDHDEDKRDPQYIPKKGNFYEHDDRTSKDEEHTTAKKQLSQKPCDKGERWGHDLYDEKMQSPKSRTELVDSYGYDIRVEEEAPKARQRRRYGRGPNKYTRRWEEEEAYAKSSRGSWRTQNQTGPPRINRKEFPSLPSKVYQKTSEENKTSEVSKKEEENKESASEVLPPPATRTRSDETYAHSSPRARFRSRRGFRGSQPFKSVSTYRKGSTAEEDIATLSQHFSQAVINVDNKSIPSQKPSSDPPIVSTDSNKNLRAREPSEEPVNDKLKTEAKSKRYSTQRQRSLLPQNSGSLPVVQQPPAPPPTLGFIQTDQQPYFLEATTGSAAGQFTNQAPPSYPADVPPLVTFMTPAPHQFHQPLPAYLPPTYLPPPPITTAPRPELYQGMTGTTYYNAQSQVSRPMSTSRRVRLAIPIVAPPPESS